MIAEDLEFRALQIELHYGMERYGKAHNMPRGAARTTYS